MTLPKIPGHVAIIMDGNGRWANRQKLPRFRGHLEGVKRVEEIAEEANQLGVRYLTLYTFSTENWRRPPSEVSMLMKTLSTVLQQRLNRVVEGNIRLHCIGRRDGVPTDVLTSLDNAIESTKKNTGLTLNLAFNYGARLEILDAVKQICKKVKEGSLSIDNIDEEMFGQELYTKDLPDPDLLIRTSGELRLSNFLLWQLSYSEFYFTEKFWPEFDKTEFFKAIEDYQNRERRYGKTSVKHRATQK